MKRRTFLQTIPLFVPTFLAAAEKPLEKQAPSDRLRVGSIGVGPMGRGDILSMAKHADIVALCDLDQEYGLAKAVTLAPIANRYVNGKKVEQKIDTYQDYRRVLDRDDIDAVAIATPDHWHIKIAIEAMQAGKHVFCQKPLTLTIQENLLIRKAVQKYGKVFQVGTQQRAQRDQFMTAALMVRAGMLGKIKRTTCFLGPGRKSGVIPEVPAPATLDWNIWLGQAPLKPYRWTNDTSFFSASNAGQGRGHLLFRWWFEYSGGRITDWGAHHIDCALWILGRQTPEQGPVSFEPSGVTFVVPYKDGNPVRDDMYNTPYDFNIVAKFADDSELVVTSDESQNGILLEGTQGRIFVNRGKIT
ncbi:MAG: Gfo/Idh/MocA family oxidoreductase, partial [Planctomycetia bacterium]|nr:Gfo/Idh/MocA family oxidoreductase [Planctomycetia bacterium]